jgi:hypothetical protein
MAKKPKYFLEYKLNAEFKVQIDPESRETLINDLARNEVALSLVHYIDDDCYSVSAYPDGIEGGELSFSQASENELHVAVNGSFFQDLDPKWAQDLIDTWKSLGELKTYSSHVYDSEPTSHYINGSEDEIEIGTISFIEK